MSDASTKDLYEVTMAMSCLREGMTGPATFSLFVRDLPPDRGFLVAAGLESALDYLADLRVGPEDVDARLVLAGEPLLEVTAPLPQAQLAETYVPGLAAPGTRTGQGPGRDPGRRRPGSSRVRAARLVLRRLLGRTRRPSRVGGAGRRPHPGRPARVWLMTLPSPDGSQANDLWAAAVACGLTRRAASVRLR
jgi:hypothetical protein